MTKYQNTILTMFTLMIEWLVFKASVYAGDKPMVDSVAKLKVSVEEAVEFSEKQAEPITDEAIVKEKNRKLMIKNGFFVSNRLLSFGTFTDNDEILVATDFPISYFNFLPGIDLINSMRYIHKLGVKYETGLLEYGVTNQMLTDFGSAIDDFELYKRRPRTAETNKKTSTDNLKDALKNCSEIAKKYTDVNIYPYKTIDSDFYQQYWLNREIVDLGYNKLAFRVNVCDGVTMEPLSLVNVTVLKTKTTHRTSEFGNCEFRTMPTATYTVKYLQEGYVEQTTRISVLKGKTKDIFIKLMPVVE